MLSATLQEEVSRFRSDLLRFARLQLRDDAAAEDAAATLLLGFGLMLLSTQIQERLAAATSGVSGAGQYLLARVRLDGLQGQFVLGLLLGIVWHFTGGWYIRKTCARWQHAADRNAEPKRESAHPWQIGNIG